MAASVIVCMCAIACLCSRVVRYAEQSDGTKRSKLRILASWAVQTMQMLVASPHKTTDEAPKYASRSQEVPGRKSSVVA